MSESKKTNWNWSHLFSASVLTKSFAQLSLKASKVYVVLKVRCNLETGIAFPSLARLAEDAGISISSVQRALIELEAAGYIESFKHKRSKKYKVFEVIEVGEGEVLRKLYIPTNFQILVQEAQEELATLRLKRVATVKAVVSDPYVEDVFLNCDLETLPSRLVDSLQRIKDGIAKKDSD